MIPIHCGGLYSGMSVRYSQAKREAYETYLAERRGLSTEELQRTVDDYDRRSAVGRFILRMSDEYALPRIEAAREVLEERLVKAQSLRKNIISLF